MCKILKAVVAVVGLAVIPMASQAVPINGSISFNGNLTAYTGGNGDGSIAGDFTTAHSIVFGSTYVSAGANGSFSGIAKDAVVTSVYSPLKINTPVVPPSALWAVGGFTFTLSSLIEPFVAPNVLVLQGAGVMHDTAGIFSDNSGTWTATFSTASSGGDVTFSWNSSSAADPIRTPNPTPEAGSSMLMLGLGMASLIGYGAVRRQIA